MGRVPVFRRAAGRAIAAARRRPDAAIAVWASREPPGLREAAAAQRIPLVRVEDGFIRSLGLGADFLPPASLVFDARGIYFDPELPGDLDILLRETRFDAGLRARAQRLIDLIVRRGVTKYNLSAPGRGIQWPAGRLRLLVPGQVEDDRSVIRGGGDIRSNLALLDRVRADNPDAYIAYKPHPDVAAGHRRGAIAPADARRYADAVITEAGIAPLLAAVDEVHTLTSLAGFEALLRGLRVVVYGRPFYAGWGLTEDRVQCDRGRRLTLEELVAGALILYPHYLDPLTRRACGPEEVVAAFDRPELWRGGLAVRARRLQGRVRRWWGDRRAAHARRADAAA